MINWMVAVGLFILGAADFATKKVSLIVIGIWGIFVMGIYLEVENLIAVGMIAITLSGLAALVLICICKKKRDYEMPFIPFVFAGYMAEQILFTVLV